MRAQSITRLAALGALVAGLACAKSLDTGLAKPDETAVKPDTAQAPPGYKAGARDTTVAPGDSLKTGAGAVTTDTTMQKPADSTSMNMPADTSMHHPTDSTSH